jgi:hypothetical protein
MGFRRIFLRGTVALVSVAAAIAIVTVANGSFGETEGQIFATIAATFVAGSAVIAGVALIERGAARALGYAGATLGTVGFLLWVEEIWGKHDSEAYWKLLGLVLAWSLALLAATTARLMSRSEDVLRTLYPATAVAAAGAAFVASVMVLREQGDGWQIFGVLLILTILGEALIPMFERLRGAPAERQGERVLGEVAGAVVVAVAAAGQRSFVDVDGRRIALARGEHVVVRSA